MTEQNQKLKKLPLGYSDLKRIIDEDCVYVDKTQLIHQMITSGGYYFVSRPRRFGKSLLVSTLAEIFSGNRELFRSLWIDKSDYDWQKYPVIRFDFSVIGHETAQELRSGIFDRLVQLESEFGVDLSGQQTLTGKFQELIIQLSKINKVVILVDEYDKPILDHIDNLAEAKSQREVLKSLYSVIKGSDQYLKFVLLTGISKFAKASVFSGINNLRDISLSDEYALLLGYTENELRNDFAAHLERLIPNLGMTVDEVVERMREQYDGYRFTRSAISLFNPCSVLTSLTEKALGNYWFASGTPEFLLHIIKNRPYDLGEIESPILDETHLDKIDVERISLTALLFQTGYLTITRVDQKTHKFMLNFPNKEVCNAFITHLADIFVNLAPERTINYAREIATVLRDGDVKNMQELLQDLFNKMPYTNHVRSERDLQFILYSIFKLIGIEVDPEVVTSLGRADLVLNQRPRRFCLNRRVFEWQSSAADGRAN